MNPLFIFTEWIYEQTSHSDIAVPAACCLSTIGLDGFPNARFVSLKEVTEEGFIITGPVSSRKGLELEANNKVALTFWWPETERQVRIQGNAERISTELADRYFDERSRDSQLVSIVSNQGQLLEDSGALLEEYEELNLSSAGQVLTRPANWGGYIIKPVRVEFLEFKTTRFHDRTLYDFEEGAWVMRKLQP